MADPAMIALRFAVYAALALVFGLPLFTLHACPGSACPPVVAALPFRRTVGMAAVAGLAASGLWLAGLAAMMSGTGIAAVDAATIDLVLSGTAIGLAWKIRVAALLLVFLAAVAGDRMPRIATAVMASAGAVALGTLAWTGHGAMDEGARGWAHLVADIVHLLAAGAWIGALFAFLVLAFRPAVDRHVLHRVLHGFASTGTLVVAVLLASGLVSGWMLVGPAGLAMLPTVDYGRLLLIKLALFVAMLGLATANRYRHTPALARATDAPTPAELRRSLLVETLAALAILWLVAWLGLLSPPVPA